MTKLSAPVRLLPQYNRAFLEGVLGSAFRQVNAISEGRITGNYNALPAAPTTGTWKQGDFIRNSAPTELGAAGSKYVVFGFLCTGSGSPGAWREFRFLTGN